MTEELRKVIMLQSKLKTFLIKMRPILTGENTSISEVFV